MKQIRKVFAATTKAADEDRALIVTISTPKPDRSGDIVEPHGVDLTNYKRNPVVLFGHNYDDLPIAKAEDLQVTDNGIVARVVFPTQGTYHKADAVYGLAKQGMINAWSIGFAAKSADTEPIEEGGVRFLKSELLEFSAVPVPANPEALTILRSKGIEEEVIDQVTIDQVTIDQITIDEVSEEEETEKPVETSKSVEAETVEKEGRVLSSTTRKQISDAVTQMKTAMEALEALMSATEPTKDEEPAPSEEAKSLPTHDHHMVLTYEQALKTADKVIGVALRNAKRPNSAS
jgi:HK97 family phage prohead protease